MKFNRDFFLMLAGIILLAGFAYFESFIKTGKDFDIFIGASKLLREHKSCYEAWIFNSHGAGLYYYSPLFAVILIPLTYLSQPFWDLVWVCANFCFLYGIIRSIDYFLPVSRMDRKSKRIFIALSALVTLRFLLANFDLSQMTIFILFASLVSLQLISENKTWQGACLLALAINIKILPLLLLPYLIYRGNFKATLFVVMFSVLFLFLPGVFVGFDFNNHLIAEWWQTLNRTTGSSLTDDVGRPTLSSFIPSLLMETKGRVDFKRNIFSLDMDTAKMILNIVRGVFVLLTLYFLKALPFKRVESRILNYYSVSYILLITPLLFPHQGNYSFFLLLPAYSYVIYVFIHLLRERKLSLKELPAKDLIAFGCLISSFIFATLLWEGLLGNYYSLVAAHYHAVTIGAFLLIIALAILNPRRLDQVTIE